MARIVTLLLIGLLTMATLRDYDYEDGATLASQGATLVNNLANTSGSGLRASTWGLLPSGTSSQKYYSEVVYPVTSTGGRSFSVEGDFDHSESDNNGGGYHAFDLLGGGSSSFISLYHGVGAGADRSRLIVYFYDGTVTAWTSAIGLIVPDTTQKLKICGTWSSASGVLDGAFSVYADDVLIIAMTGQDFYPNFDDWLELKIGAMGRFDNLLVKDTACALPDVVVTDNAAVCCSDGPAQTVADGGGQGSGAEVVQTAAIGGSAIGCAGGGLVPTQVDIVHAETWWGL